MHGAGLFFFLFFLLLIFAAVGWVVFTQYRARKAGLPAPSFKSYIPFLGASRGGSGSASNYPTPRSAGPIEWVKDKFDQLRNRRTARGAYEETGAREEQAYSAGGPRRGRGNEDDAWDTQVGNEDAYGGAAGPGGYYEEQELGLAPTPGLPTEPYGTGSSYLDAQTGYENERGRSANRSSGVSGLQPGGQGHARGNSAGQNPFGDDNEAASLRDVSPRPEPTTHIRGQPSLDPHGGAGDTSPISTRKSMFREGLD